MWVALPLGPDVHAAHQASGPLSAEAGKGSLSPSPCPEPGDTMYTPGAPVGPQRVRRLAMSPRDASPPQRGHPLAAVTASPAGHLLSALDLVCGRHTGLATVGAESWWGGPQGWLRETLREDRQDTAHRSDAALTCAARSAARPEVRHRPVPPLQEGCPPSRGCPARTLRFPSVPWGSSPCSGSVGGV